MLKTVLKNTKNPTQLQKLQNKKYKKHIARQEEEAKLIYKNMGYDI